jgi:predicted membrane protein
METNRKSIFGLVLIILGIYFLLENLDVIDIHLPWYFFTWQMLLIAIGLFNLLTGNRKAALILCSIGVFFFLPEFFDFDIRDYWPVLLIFIGVSFFMRSRSAPNSSISDANAFDDFTLFGSNEKSITSLKFQGGKASTIFGSTELDFREAQLDGSEAVIDAFTMFGSTELYVPKDWEVLSEVTPILGSFENKRGNTDAPGGSKKLIVKGLVMFGAVEVKS